MQMSTSETWPLLLDEYKRVVKRIDEYDKYNLNSAQIESNILNELAEKDTVTGDSASEQIILNTEEVLGLELPLSYKNFLRYSNGLHWRNWPLHLLPVELIGRVVDTNPLITQFLRESYIKDKKEWVETFLQSFDARQKNKNGTSTIYNNCILEYLDDLIQVSICDEEIGAVLLNPKRLYDDEWEVYSFNFKAGGMQAYSSFAEYLEAIIPNLIDDNNWYLEEKE